MKLVPGRSQTARRKKALATMAGLVGALILSRAVDDPALSDEYWRRRQRNSDGADGGADVERRLRSDVLSSSRRDRNN